MRAWAIAWVLLLAGTLPAIACMETRRSLGDDCLKDSDCLSGVCSQLHCAAAPPTIDAQVIGDGAPMDTGVDVPGVSSDATPERDGEVDGADGGGASSEEPAPEQEASPGDAPTDGDGSGD